MPATDISLDVLGSTERLNAFEPEWQGFLQRIGATVPFQTPEWLLTWWKHFGGSEPRVFVFRRNAQIAGVIPCFLHEWKSRRQMTLMGSGISDYLDPVIEPRNCQAIMETLTAYLRQSEEWDVLDWQDLSGGTPLAAVGDVAQDTPCNEVKLAPDFDTFLASRPSHLKKNLRYYERKASGMGNIEFSVSEQADPKLIATLIEQHSARWREAGQPGTIAANGMSAFLQEVTTVLAKRNMLRIFTLTFDAAVVAIVFALRMGEALFSYLTAFDPAYKQYSFGHELLSRAFQYAHENGYRRWDFLRGDEQYKVAWGAQRIPKFRILATKFRQRIERVA